jgi:peptidylprolyl isomerase
MEPFLGPTKVATMATTKRERQKAARRQKLEQMQRANKRRKTIRRGIIVAIVAVLVVGSAALLFSNKGTPTTTTTTSSSTTTTTAAPTTTTTTPPKIGAISSPLAAGTFGKAPTVSVPAGAAPTNLEVDNLIVGTGAIAQTGDTLTGEYVLATYSTRKVVQSSWSGQPFSFTLSPSAVIPGFADAIVGMRVGGRREIIIPPLYGYGDASPGTGIAKNDTLVFVFDLTKVTS